MSVILKNNVEGFLATTISASDVSLVLQPGDGAAFPNPVSPDYFYATLVSTGGTVEVVRVTARAGDTLSILRGQDGTTANSFAAGSRLEMRVNAQSVIDTVYSITNYQGASTTNPTTRLDGSALQAGDFYFNTSAAEVRFYNGVAWQSLTTGSIDVQNFVGNGTQTTFTLSQAPTGEDNTQVYIKGVYQQKDTYSISGLSLIFSTAPPAGTTIEVVTLEALAIGQTSSDLVSYQPAGVAAVPTTVREKLRETVSVKDFGAVGDGVTDDTVAITNFFNSAISNPGVRHYMDAAVYLVTDILPDINVSNVRIEGAGVEVHDVGDVLTGTVLKWGGASGTLGPLVKITAIPGSGNQRISSVVFNGIGIDCNNGAIDYGMQILSARFCKIYVAIVEAGNTGLLLGVVSGSLGEGKDLQRCTIKLQTRQFISDGFGLVLGGDTVSNVSLNEFWVDAQIKNIQAIYCANSDNNDWNFVRVIKSSGTATEGVSLLGGATADERARGERFNYYTSNVPIHVYGTTSVPPYTFASTGNSVFLDKENNTPNPVIDGGGEIGIIYDSTELPENDWVEYTPVVSASIGSVTSYTAKGYYAKRGRIIYVRIEINISDNGTGAGFLTATMPTASLGFVGSVFVGRERGVTQKAVTGFIDGGAVSNMTIVFYDGVYPGGAGHIILLSGFYEIIL